MKLYNGSTFVDDRGSLRFVNDFDFDKVKRFYQVENHEQGFIRAWHGHLKESKYVYVPRGTAQIGLIAMNADTSVDENIQAEKYILSDKSPKVLYIPSKYYNGFKTLEQDTIVMFFSTVTMKEAEGDDYRFPYEKFPIFTTEYR